MSREGEQVPVSGNGASTPSHPAGEKVEEKVERPASENPRSMGGRFGAAGMPLERSKDLGGSLRRLVKVMATEGLGGSFVFILAVGYYITPALVGGASGQLFSNMIAFHMQRSLNWSLAAALAAILLGAVLLLYWLYDRLVGIDNMKLG